MYFNAVKLCVYCWFSVIFSPLNLLHVLKFSITCYLCLISVNVQANNLTLKNNQSWASFTWDNDVVVGEDGAYTNGLYASVYNIYPDSKKRELDNAWYFEIQRLMLRNSPNEKYVELHNFGQLMITPIDINKRLPDVSDGLYAGVLFWQGSLLMADDEHADIASLLLGVVGPLSVAEQTQKMVHDITGSTEPQGWDTQLENELVFTFTRGRYWRLPVTQLETQEMDWVGGLELDIGTFGTALDGSLYIRLGEGLAGSYATFSLVSHRQSNPMAFPSSYYFYAGVSTGYSFYNVIFDGNTYRDSRSLERDRFTNIATFGFTWSAQSWGVSMNLNKSDVLVETDNESIKFASITLYWRI